VYRLVAKTAGWMRIVLDTNVLVSAALKQKSTPGMAVLAVERHGGLLKSLATEQPDGTVEMPEEEAEPFLRAGWVRVDIGDQQE
jgi:hypothetical protein